jgi:hypothetical protein
LFPGDVIYIWHASGRIKDIWIALEELGFDLRQQSSGTKCGLSLAGEIIHYNHDPCFYGVRRGKTSQWTGDRETADGMGHSAQGVRDEPRGAEAGRVHAAADREQFKRRAGGL